MDQKDKTATIVAAVIVGVFAVTGTVYAAVSTSRDEAEPESSSSIITTTTEPATEATSEAATTTTTTQPPKTTTAAPTQPATPGATASAPQEITFEYDAELSRQIGVLLEAKFKGKSLYTPSNDLRGHPENYIQGTVVAESNFSKGYTGPAVGEESAQGILNAWTRFSSGWVEQIPPTFTVEAFRYSNGYYFVYFY